MTQADAAALQDFAKQEIRVAAVLSGGVSLAVWMSGVVLEMHHLTMASQRLGQWDGYRDVLDTLGATARVDVIAGTSAGGLNGAFLALGINRRRDFALLRDVWAQDGALEKLLRRPLEKAPPSALAGDGYFLLRIQEALQAMVGSDNPDLDPSGTSVAQPVELILTGTLWQGRQSTYTDDMGVAITERDYNATFRFVGGQGDAADGAGQGAPPQQTGSAGNLDDATNAVLSQLAAAARCTSSFPGAFEPHYVQVGTVDQLAGRWSSTAGQANFAESQYVIDGGVLMNKPVRPALDAIYRQTAEKQVRRVLGYVVPDPGNGATAVTAAVSAAPTPVPAVPVATDVLLGVLTRLTSTDSVSRELSDIRDTNISVREHRKARARLCVAMATGDAQMAKALWGGYISERIDEASSTVGALIYAGQPTGPGAWSVEELTAGLARVGSGPVGFGFVPRGTLEDALAGTGERWSRGQTTLGRLADLTVDLFKRAVTLAPLNQADTQGQLVRLRPPLAATVEAIAGYGADLHRFWVEQGASTDRPMRSQAADPGAVGAPAAGSADNLDALDAWLVGLCGAWDRVYGQDDGSRRHRRQYDGALALATALLDAREPIAAVLAAGNDRVDPSGGEFAQLDAFYRWLLPESADADEVLRRMLQLDIVLLATAGALADPEQEVQLVQVSCGDATRVTGMQLHHFGAFYRTPWRLNDWIEGRMDGARQLMRMLLDPDRLRQRGYTTDALLAALHDIAVPAGHRDLAWLQSRWDGNLSGYRTEVDQALQPDAPATALDLLSDAVALPGQLAALRDDLSALADAVRAEGHDTAGESRAWLAQYDAVVAAAGRPPGGSTPSTAFAGDQLWALRQSMSLVGNQQISADIGSDTFARTVSHASVVATGAFMPKTKLAHVRAVQVVLSALRGYVAMVYGMVAYLTRGSVVGTRGVELAVAAGGVLVAVTIFVPSVPIGLTLAGVLVLLAGASASALLTKGTRGMGLRLLLAGLLVAAALGYLIWRDVHQYGWHGQVLSTLIKVGVGVLVVALGWFVANGGTHRSSRR